MSGRFVARVSEDESFWDCLVDRAAGGSLFHKDAWLKTAAEYSGCKLAPLIVYRGEEPAGLCPIFYKSRYGVNLAFSPPPGFDIPRLGPVLFWVPESQTEKEKVFEGVWSAVSVFLNQELGFRPDYFSISVSGHFSDVRPLIWDGFRVVPKYTYFISLDRELEEIQKTFSKRIRQYIRNGLRDGAIAIKRGSSAELGSVHGLIRERFREQGMRYEVPLAYLQSLYEACPDNFEILGAFHEGRLLSGLILLKYKKTLSHWIGSPAPKKFSNAVNSLLYWESIVRGKRAGMSVCEIMGANTRQLCAYKSRYNPALGMGFSAVRTTRKGAACEWVYRRLRGR